MFITLFILIFFTTNFFAYDDYGIIDLELPTSITADQNLDVNVTLSNTTSGEAAISLTLLVYNPEGVRIFNKDYSITVDPGASVKQLITIDSALSSDFESSNQPYLLRASIIDNVGNVANNMSSKYFTIRKSSSKIPVPDMPYYFPILLIAFISIFLISKNKKGAEKK